MNTSTTRAWVGLAVLVVVLGLLLFVPAGSLHYWQGRGCTLPSLPCPPGAITYYLMKRDPALLARRMRGGPSPRRNKASVSSCTTGMVRGVVRSYSAKNSICAACWSNSRRRSAPGATWARTGTVSAPTSIVASGCASRL